MLHAVVAGTAASRPGAPGVALAETGQSCRRPAEELQQEEQSAERSHRGGSGDRLGKRTAHSEKG